MISTAFLLLIIGAVLFLYIVNIIDPNGKTRKTQIERSIFRHICTMNSIDDKSVAVRYLVPYEKNLWWNTLRKKLKVHLYQYVYTYKKDPEAEKRFSNITLVMPRNKYFHLSLTGHVNTTDKEMAQQVLDKINCKWKLP